MQNIGDRYFTEVRNGTVGKADLEVIKRLVADLIDHCQRSVDEHACDKRQCTPTTLPGNTGMSIQQMFSA